ncbi:unnamed protein product [Nezara viridula]|uniref:Uncharacterized protein n=1 Tax=Nezara viridula TaxID=85310 RepID=A0A9P0MXQ8_NEZVI|nr:unnamed protein product [Nezara viridula]
MTPPYGRVLTKNYFRLIKSPPPRKSLVKGERFIRFEGRPEVLANCAVRLYVTRTSKEVTASSFLHLPVTDSYSRSTSTRLFPHYWYLPTPIAAVFQVYKLQKANQVWQLDLFPVHGKLN